MLLRVIQTSTIFTHRIMGKWAEYRKALFYLKKQESGMTLAVFKADTQGKGRKIMKLVTKILFAVALLAGYGSASAVPCAAISDDLNYMVIADPTPVTDCLDAGVGNINGNPMNDAFLTGGGTALGYVFLGKDDDGPNPFNVFGNELAGGPGGSSGEWGFDADAWDSYSALAIGFKFGTGQTGPSWFVFSGLDPESGSTWTFTNCTAPDCGMGGSGLSHTNLYGILATDVPEPGTLALFGTGLILIALRRRRRPI